MFETGRRLPVVRAPYEATQVAVARHGVVGAPWAVRASYLFVAKRRACTVIPGVLNQVRLHHSRTALGQT
jgi:hypothetical protein